MAWPDYIDIQVRDQECPKAISVRPERGVMLDWHAARKIVPKTLMLMSLQDLMPSTRPSRPGVESRKIPMGRQGLQGLEVWGRGEKGRGAG